MLRWALALGRTPRELLATTTSDELTEMMAFERLEPFGAIHAEFMAGQVCAVMANTARGKDADPYRASDFMPSLARVLRPPEPQTVDDPDAYARLLDATLFGIAPA